MCSSFILGFRNWNSRCEVGKEGQARHLVQVKCRQSLVLCQLEKTHIKKQLHKSPDAVVPGTLLHMKYCMCFSAFEIKLSYGSSAVPILKINKQLFEKKKETWNKIHTVYGPYPLVQINSILNKTWTFFKSTFTCSCRGCVWPPQCRLRWISITRQG